MVTFDTLPHEILLDVFEIVRDTDFESFLSIPLTCSRFFHVAQPLLYRHISFSLDWDFPYSLPKFATPLANKEWVRSISVKGFRYNRRRTCSMLVAGPIIEYDYESVYRLLSSLDRLETFSLQLDHDQEYRSDLFPTAVLQRLLQRLPKSVVNLELDTNGCDDMWEHGHICPTIREILPQLEVLRLRVSQLCDDLVGRSPKDDSGQLSCVYPRLRIAVVPLYFSFRELDRFEESDEHILECARPHASESDEHQLDPTIFANRLRNIYTAARFPRLQYFLLLEEHVSVWTREFAYSSYRVRNIVSNNMLTIPRTEILNYHDAESNIADKFDIFARVDESVDETRPKTLMLLRDCAGEGILGFNNDIETSLEGPLVWKEISNGSRMPPGRSRPWSWEQSTATLHDRIAAESPWETFTTESGLLAREKQLGHRLLRASFSDGFSAVPAPREFFQRNGSLS